MKNKCCYKYIIPIALMFFISVLLFGIVIGLSGAIINLLHILPREAGSMSGYIVALISSIMMIWAFVRVGTVCLKNCKKASHCDTDKN